MAEYCILCGELLMDYEIVNCNEFCYDCFEEARREEEKERTAKGTICPCS
jgi:hypothetical protein